MTDDWSGTGDVDEDFTGGWADRYELTFPVIGNRRNFSSTLSGLGSAGMYSGGIPFMILLDREMRIDSYYTGSGSEGRIEARAEELL
jgi:hypothetical protein